MTPNGTQPADNKRAETCLPNPNLESEFLSSRRLDKAVFFNRAYPPSDQATAVLLRQLVSELDPSIATEVIADPTRAGRWSRLLSFVVYGIYAALRALTMDRNCLGVIWTDPPMFNTVIARILQSRGIPYVQVVQDLYPEILFRVGLTERSAPLARFLIDMQKQALQAAEQVVAISPDMADFLATAYGVPRDQIEVVQNWSPIMGNVTPISGQGSRSADRAAGKRPFVVKYAGNLGVGMDYKCLAAIARGCNGRSDVKIVVQGSGRYRQRIEDLAREVSCIELATRVPGEKVASSLEEADAFLLPMPAHLLGTLFPSKVYAYAALGRPIVATAPASSYLHTLIGENGLGLTSDSADPQAAVDNILSLSALKASHPQDYTRFCENGRRFADQRWNLSLATSSYLKLFRRLGVMERPQKTAEPADQQGQIRHKRSS